MGNLKVWVTGAKGQLGSAVCERLEKEPDCTVFCTDRETDIAKLDEITGFAREHRPDVIVNCAGMTDLAECERNVEEAYRVNLVNKVVPQSELMAAVDAFCTNLTNKSANVLDFIKRAVDYGTETDLRSAAQYEAALFGVISATEDKKEGMGAFMEKRAPVFADR